MCVMLSTAWHDDDICLEAHRQFVELCNARIERCTSQEHQTTVSKHQPANRWIIKYPTSTSSTLSFKAGSVRLHAQERWNSNTIPLDSSFPHVVGTIWFIFCANYWATAPRAIFPFVSFSVIWVIMLHLLRINHQTLSRRRTRLEAGEKLW